MSLPGRDPLDADCRECCDEGGLCGTSSNKSSGSGNRQMGFLQLRAVLTKNFTEKRRNIRVTLCESFSHLLIAVILLLGYNVSKIRSIGSADYSTLTLKIPPSFLVPGPPLPKSTSSSSPTSTYSAPVVSFPLGVRFLNDLLTGPLVVPTLQQYLQFTQVVAPAYNQLDPFTRRLVGSTRLGASLGNLLNRGVFHFAPADSPQLKSLLAYLYRTTPVLESYTVYTHATEAAAVRFILKRPEQRTFALVVLRSVSAAKVNYVLRMNYTTLPNTNSVVSRTNLGLNSLYQYYLTSGFMSLERTVDDWAFSFTGATNTSGLGTNSRCAAKPEPFIMPFPTEAFSLNPFYSQVGFLLGLGLVMATLYPVSRLVKTLVEEKETRMKELMKIMGLLDYVYQLAWLITAFVLFFWIAISMAYVCSTSFLKNSNRFIVFVFFSLFCISEVPFCFLLSVFFSNSKLASIAAPVLLFATILPRYIFFSTNNSELWQAKYAASLLSPTAFSFGADIISNYELTGVGIQWSNLFDDSYSFGGCMALMFIDFWIYGLLALYFDQVLPSEYGTRRHPLFFLSYRYWCPARGAKEYSALHDSDEEAQDLPEFANTSSSINNNNFETLDKSQLPQARVRIRRLRKRYPDGKVAVKSVSMAMLEGQITCLLGSNGAGKTTCISILTGLFEATSGDVSIYGRKLDTELQTIRQMTGICPQHNVLVPCLTVCEHLTLFGKIKGMSGRAFLNKAIDELLAEVGLTEKKHVQSQALSGGQKRKLCLACALIGDPKFVLVDEATSGMDPYSRRSTWELLQRCKAGRVIVLTTHFMDEADALGDRIMIMSEGRLRCSGSPLFLKTRFGAGYLLSMAKTSGLCDPEAVQSAVQEVVPSAQLSQHVAGEMVFQLPLSSVSSFAALFARLKDGASDLMIGSYGISITSLEQVFIRLAKEAKDGEVGGDGDDDDDDDQREGWLVSSARKAATAAWKAARNLVFPAKTVPFTSISTFASASASARQTGDGDGDGDVVVYQPHVSRPAPSPSKDTPRSVIHPLDADNTDAKADAGAGGGGDQQDEARPFANFAGFAPEVVADEEKAEDTRKDKEDGGIQLMPVGVGAGVEVEVPKVRPLSASSASASAVRPLSPLSSGGKGFLGRCSSHYQSVSPSEVVEDDNEDDEEKAEPAEARATAGAGGNDAQGRDKSSRCLGKQGLVWIQIKELLRKRLIIASRDFKGFFFQVLFPTVQVALVLAVLTVNISPAGRTVRLLSSTYQKRLGYKVDFVVGGLQRGFLAPTLQLDSLSLLSVNTTATFGPAGLSARLGQLQRRRGTRSSRRYGALQFNDTVGANITVDWTWVRANLPFILQNQALIEGAAALVGVNLNLNNELLSSVNANVQIPAGFNVTNFLDTNNITDASTATARNQAGVNVTVSSVARAVTRGGSNATVNVRASSLTFDPVTGRANLVGASVRIGNLTAALGNVSLPASEVALLLPTGMRNYYQGLPSAYSLLHNTSSPHAVAIFYAQVIADSFAQCSPAFLRLGSNSAAEMKVDRKQLGRPVYAVKNHPLPLTVEESLEIKVIISVFASLFILIPLCYIPASFVAFVVRERSSKSLHLQLISGVSPHIYWISTFMWDASLYFVLTSFVLIAFFCYGRQAAQVFISTNEASTCVFLLILLYGLSCIPLSYLYSFLFDNHSTAQISIMTWNFLTGFVAVLAYFIMSTIPETRDAAKQVVLFFRFFPPYLVGEGLVSLSSAFFTNLVLRRSISYFDWEVCGRPLVFMFLEMIGYFSLVLVSEAEVVKRILYRIEKASSISHLLGSSAASASAGVLDSDVKAEAEAMEHANPDQHDLIIRGLSKVYPPPLLASAFGGRAKHAVRHISLGCKAGERLGLLGINGAGKTTTLGVLTGDIQPTAGQVFVCGVPLEDREAVRTYVGYCPQVDPLLDLMTAYETLWFFGRIRGVDEEVLKGRVDQLVQQVGLAKHAHRPCGTYSGGNKRKLSLAIALISDPRLLLLDEPSTGMDPAARRNMWSVIEQVSQDRSIVLVSHSMEECEALCTRMCVLVSGRLKCLGSAQHIKGKFGASYQLEVRCAKAEEEGGGDESVDRIIRLCQEGLAHCGGATVDERHSGFLRMSLDGAVDLAAAFALLEASKDTHGVLDYSIAQATLEQVFISFAKEQEEETGPVRGMVAAVAEAEVQAQAEGNKGLVADSKEALDGGVI